MARIQVLPLTTETAGAVTATPFAVIIDQIEDERDEIGWQVWTAEMAGHLTSQLGARVVLMVQGTLDVANVDEKLHEAAQAAVERALTPVRSVTI